MTDWQRWEGIRYNANKIIIARYRMVTGYMGVSQADVSLEFSYLEEMKILREMNRC